MSQSGDFEHGLAWMARALSYFLRWYLVAVQVILGLTFILLLFGANQDSEFVRWTYRSADRAMGPFRGIFQPIDFGTEQVSATFDTSILFAMIVYGLIVMLVDSLIGWLNRSMRRMEVEDRLERQNAAYRDAATPAPAGSAPPDVVGDAQRSAGQQPDQATPNEGVQQ